MESSQPRHETPAADDFGNRTVSNKTSIGGAAPDGGSAAKTTERALSAAHASVAQALEQFARELRETGVSVRGAFGRFDAPGERVTVEAIQQDAVPQVATFTLPVTRNDGSPVGVSELVELLHDVFHSCGGVTARIGFGFVRDRYVEVDVLLELTIWTTDLDAVTRLVERWCSRLGQREVDILLTRPRVICVRGVDGTEETAAASNNVAAE